MASKNIVAQMIHRDMCDDDRNGYSWSPRQGGDYGANKTLSIDGQRYTYKLGSYDCASSTCEAWSLALGINLRGLTTYGMKAAFLATGLFEWKPMSFLAGPGDLYLDEDEHVAMCQSQEPDILSEFCINENGGVYGGKVGDQTGWEAYVHGYYDADWDGILHYIGEGDATGGSSGDSGQQPAKDDAQWQGDVIGREDTTGAGDDYAGVLGKPIKYIAIDGVGEYQVSDVVHEWFWAPVNHYDLSDEENGYAGNNCPVDGLRITDPTVHYQLHKIGYPADEGWHEVMTGTNDSSGYDEDFAGEQGVQHDLVRMWRDSGDQPRYNVYS